METLTVKNFGPIRRTEVTFGDLTILIGPQASGKSLFLEMFKFVSDKSHILSTLRKYNYIIKKTNLGAILDIYFGEGMSSAFTGSTEIACDGERVKIDLQQGGACSERVFYVPAQRILSISDGRPKNFMEFEVPSTPYVLRNFSETLRVFIQSGLGNPEVLFPMKARLKGVVKKSINEAIFHGGRVVIDQSSGMRKMKLQVNGARLPFMTWSAGQKEFMPLLLAIYCLSGPPSPVINKKDYEWVVIEEPEMGLHPRAIEAVMLEVIELMQAGYKVIISTHTPVLLEFAWAFETLRQGCDGDFGKAMSELFGMDDGYYSKMFDDIGKKKINTYYFHPGDDGGIVSSDISSLDAGDENTDISEWGGLSTFASKASEIVGKYYKG